MANENNVIDALVRTGYDDTGVKQATKDFNNLEDKTKKMGGNLGKMFDVGKFAVFGAAIKRAAGYIADVTKKSADYIETLNVLQVAFDGNTESIRKFSSQLSDTLNLDDSTIISAAAHFKVLTQSMGIATETGEKLAELMTKMTLDLSSLYNMDFDKAQTALQYAMEGRGTSLKQRTGVSVLETSVQTTMDVLGIDAYVEDMNDAEKAIARVISMEYQLMSSQGDLARTIEAPANQIRVMKEQISMLARNIGNVLLPIVAKILPYFNALLIVLNAIISALARLVGYKEDMFDTFEDANTIEYFDGVGSAIDGVGRSAESAAKKMQGLRGFDKLNVIKTPTETGGAGGAGGGVGGINPNLLKAFNDMADQYKQKLEGVKTKATEIAEKILTWLGFAKRINKETGKTEWYFKKLTSGTLIGAFGVGGFILLGINKILKLLGKIGLIKYTGLKDLVGAFKTIISGGGIIGKITAAFEGLAAALGISAAALAAIVVAVVAVVAILVHAYNTSEDFRNSVKGLFDSIGDLFVWNQIKDNITLVLGILYDTVVFVFQQMFDSIAGWVRIFTDLINGDFDKAIEDFKKMVVSLWENWDTYIGKIGDKFKEWIGKTLERAKDFIPKLLAKLGEFVAWLKELPAKCLEYVGEAVGTIIRVVITTDWLELGGKILNGIVKGVKDIKDKVVDFGSKMFDKIKEAIKNIDWGKVGKNILDGIINGMFGFQNKLNDWANSFVKGLKKGLGIASPSKLVLNAKIGDFSMDAIIEGMERQLPLLDKEAQHIVDTLNDGMEKANTNLSNATNTIPDIDSIISNSKPSQSVIAQANKNIKGSNAISLMQNQDTGGLKNATFVIQIGDEQIAKKVLKDLNGMAKSNGKPITIRG